MNLSALCLESYFYFIKAEQKKLPYIWQDTRRCTSTRLMKLPVQECDWLFRLTGKSTQGNEHTAQRQDRVRKWRGSQHSLFPPLENSRISWESEGLNCHFFLSLSLEAISHSSTWPNWLNYQLLKQSREAWARINVGKNPRKLRLKCFKNNF